MNKQVRYAFALVTAFSLLHLSACSDESQGNSLSLRLDLSHASCVVTSESLPLCWGDEMSGIGLPADLGKVKQVSTGGFHRCAILEAQSVRCWWGPSGPLSLEDLGTLDFGQADVPENLGKVRQISAGSHHTCAIGEDSLLSCWGAKDQSIVPQNLGKVLYVSSPYYATCVITEFSLVECWGYDGLADDDVPVTLGKVKQLSVGFNHTCVVTVEDNAECWAHNYPGSIAPYNDYVAVPKDLGKVSQIGAGSYHTCALKQDGFVRCWGSSNNPTNPAILVPTGLGKVKVLSVGSDHACAIKDDGFLRCWGDNSYGQLEVPSNLGKF